MTEQKQTLLGMFDEYVLTLRILAGRFLGADRIEDLPELPASDWRKARWYDSLWLFELAGIRASGYPAVFDNAASAVYATPEQFIRLARWEAPPAGIALDPRYVAFRTIHDWIVLNAKLLDDASADSSYPNPFEEPLPVDSPDGPIGLTCGNPLRRLHRGLPKTGDDNYLVPDWRDVQDHFAAIRYFHYRGLLLPEELRYGALRETPDPRLTQLELLRPEVFAAYVSGVLWKRLDDGSLPQWRTRPVEDIERDPRFIAHRCGFDREMILYIASKDVEEEF